MLRARLALRSGHAWISTDPERKAPTADRVRRAMLRARRFSLGFVLLGAVFVHRLRDLTVAGPSFEQEAFSS